MTALESILKSGTSNDTSTKEWIDQRSRLEKDLHETRQKTPTKADAWGETLNSMAGSLGPKNHFTPVLGGLSAGLKLSSLQDRKEDLKKYERVMAYLSAVNQEAISRNERIQKNNDVKSSMIPQISAYAQMSGDMDPQTKELRLRQMLSEWNQKTKDNKEFVSVSATDPFMISVIENGQSKNYDLKSFFAPDDAAQKDFAMTLSNIALKEQSDRKIKEEQLRLGQENINLGHKNHDQRQELNNPDNIRERTQAGEDPKYFNKYYDDLRHKVSHVHSYKRDLKLMLHMLDKNQVITADHLGSEMKQWLTNHFGGDQKGKQQTFDQLATAFLPKLKEMFGSRITDVDLKLGEARMFAGQNKHKEANRMLIENALRAMQRIEEEDGLVNKVLEENNYQVPMGAVYRIQSDLRKKYNQQGKGQQANATQQEETIMIKGPNGVTKPTPGVLAEKLLKKEGFSRA